MHDGLRPPASITSAFTAVPEHTVTLEQVRAYAGRLFDLERRRLPEIRAELLLLKWN